MGEDEKTYAGNIFAINLSTTYVLAASKSAARK
jgi:hypothetical protein